MKIFRKAMMILLVVAALLIAVFAAGRYGWKLLGYQTGQGAGIESVDVSENNV